MNEASRLAADPDEDERRNERIGAIAEEFLERYRRGESPSPEEYCKRSPELAGRLRELFPTLIVLEEVGSSSTGLAAATATAGLDRIGNYRILRRIGHGGMGVVFEAEQLAVNRRVALKLLLHWRGDARTLVRFRREAAAIARLHHTHIIPVFEAGEESGVLYFAMQFIDGPGLDEVVARLRSERGDRRGPTRRGVGERGPAVAPPVPMTRAAYRWAARIALDVATALEHAHARGVVHRDIKPSNLLLDERGEVWITDFGLAKTDEEAITMSGDPLGTARYMAPERFSRLGDARVDVYGLGATLYELLTLRPAFDEADRAQLVRDVLLREPPDILKLAPGLDRDLATIVQKAMSKEPEHRYRSAGELAEDLRRHLADLPIAARPMRLGERLRRRARRNPTVAALSTSLVVLLATGLAAVGWKWSEAEQLRREERAASTRAGRLAREIADSQESLRRANELRDRARREIDMRHWDDAERLLGEAIALRPDQAGFLDARAHEVYARLGLWDLAAADLRRSFEICEPANAWEYWSHALLRLREGDRAGYERICERAGARFLGSGKAEEILTTVRILALAPAPRVSLKAPAGAADRLLAVNHEPWDHYTSGCAAFRAEEWSIAIRRFRTALEADPPWSSRGMVRPLLAIALTKNGETEAARDEFSKAKAAHSEMAGRLAQWADARWVVHYRAIDSWPINCWDWLEWGNNLNEACDAFGEPPVRDPSVLSLKSDQ